MEQVRVCNDVPKAQFVSVEPESEDDWELVELNATYVEENLLSQVHAQLPEESVPSVAFNHIEALLIISCCLTPSHKFFELRHAAVWLLP